MRISKPWMVALAAVFVLGQSAGPTQAAPGAMTKIKVNGLSADTFLTDDPGHTYGFLNASRDQLANTSALDFAHATPDPADPDIVILIAGAGEIPNSAFVRTATSAHLALTTPFPVTRCVVDTVTSTFDCNPYVPYRFDLTWTLNGFSSVNEKVKRTETLGPLETKFEGEFSQLSAKVSGTWTGHTVGNMMGNLVDTRNTTAIREITMKANP